MKARGLPILMATLVLVAWGFPAFGQEDLDALLGGRGESAAPEKPSTGERPAVGESPAREEPPSGETGDPASGDEGAGADVSDAPASGDRAAPAAEPSRRRVIEEIIVTAQKSEESLQDVPISMSVVDDELMAQEGITDFRDLALYVPNATIDNTATFPDIRIRGFGSPLSNKAFEQPVALVIDGVPYGRTSYWQGPLFDLERVEALRGPQGTLFGKNTTAGLFNVVTKQPTDELTGYLDLELGELDRRRLEGGVGGPIVAGLLNFRLSGISDERDGLVENTTAAVTPTANDRMNGRDRKGIRAQVGLPNLLGASLVVSYEHVDLELVGTGWEFRRVSERELEFFREYDPRTDIDPANHRGSIDRDELGTRTLDTVVANARYDLGDWRFDGIASHSVLDSLNRSDVDFTPAPIFFTDSVDVNPQTTFEVRTTSPSLSGLLGLESLFGLGLGRSDFTAGFFFQRRTLGDSRLAIGLNVPVLAQFVAAQGGGSQVPGGALPVGVVLPIDADDLQPLLDAGVGVEESTGIFDQTTTSFAGFGHVNWHVAERWTLQYGMRVTEESKDADIAREFTQGTGLAFNLVAGQEEFSTSRSRSEFAFTPKVVLRYDWADTSNVFASWTEGFKAGGFNELASNGTEGLEFETEKATSWEVGSKTDLLDGAARVNVGLFWMNVTDLQVFTLRPENLVATVVNAGEARARGAEVDSSWLPTNWLTLLGTFAFNDAEYLEFPFGDCPMDRENTDGDDDPRCDLSGEPLYRTPKWAGTLLASVTVPIATMSGLSGSPLLSLPGVDLIGSLGGEYQDVHFVERTSDPRSRQPSFFRFNASIGFENVAQGWTARLSVRNLTDETVAIQSRGITLGQGTFAHILEEPRLIFGSLQWRF